MHWRVIVVEKPVTAHTRVIPKILFKISKTVVFGIPRSFSSWRTVNRQSSSIVSRTCSIQSVQQERVLVFSKTIRDFWTFFFNGSTFKRLRRNYQGDSVALESSERADVSHNEFCVRETFWSGFERYKANKTVDNVPERGKSRATTSKQDKAIIKLFERLSTLRLREAKAILVEKRVNISINTIRQRLAESNIKYRSTRQKSLLSETHMEKRKAWAAENLDRDWSNVIFSDELSFWAWVPIKYAWSTVGSNYFCEPLNTPWRSMFGDASQSAVLGVKSSSPRTWMLRKCSKYMKVVF